MLKLDTSDETLIRNWPVLVNVPQDGGNIARHEITADYVLLPQEQYDEQIAASRDSDGNSDIEMLMRVVRRVGGVADADGNALDYTPELLERLIKKTYIRVALINAYWAANSGHKAKRKN